MDAPVEMKGPYYPIVYVRGYAGSQSEVEDTVATPYMGLNLGSTKIRQLWSGDIERYVFESPLVRLIKDHGYTDVYEGGAELSRDKRPKAKTVWIYRYYEPVSKQLGTGFRPEIEHYAEGLHKLIESMRDHYCGLEGDKPAAKVKSARAAFKVYLVAHSMGGLVVRCYLQKIAPEAKATPPVDKVFTYATPHGGIDFRLIGNVPKFLQVNNVENFEESRMREYLKIPDEKVSVQSLNDEFDPDRFFCLVGTNRHDYEAALGLSRAAVGPMSDGLVQIKNATVKGSPRALVYRSHSGDFGIVNSEEGYQMLRRFLFGNLQVDGLLQIDSVTVPEKVAAAERKGKVKYSYHVEVIAAVRGVRWDLHRRTVGEESAKFVPAERLKRAKADPIHLVTTFLMRSARKNKRRQTMGFSIELGVLVPEYEVDGFLWMEDHHEGGYVFRDKLNLEVNMSARPARLRYGWDREAPNGMTSEWMDPDVGNPTIGEGLFFRIPVEQTARPGLKGSLILRARPWN